MKERERIGSLAWMSAVLLLSAALFWHDLGAREVLGQDENLTITQLDQPNLVASLEAAHLKATGQPSNMQPFYFLPQHLFWPLVKRSAFVLRFLPSVFAILAVAFTYKLGEALLGRKAGLIGALLTALLPLTVHYAQIARPYTLLATFSLASAYFLVRALATNQPLHWAGFVLTATLNFYTHYNALFVLLAEGLYAAAVWLVMLAAVLKKQESPRRLLGPGLGFLAVGLLCIPGLVRLIQLPWVGTRGTVQVELTFTFFHRFLYKIGLRSTAFSAMTTAWLQGLVLGLMSLGLAASLYRRRWQPALFAVLWLALPFLVLSVMKSPRPFVERYVIFVPPVALLLVGEGAATLGQALGDLGRRWNASIVRGAVTLVLAAGLALLFVAPLRAYYAANQAADRLDRTLEVIERHARPGDVIIVSPRFFVRLLNVRGAEALYLTEHLVPAEFEELLSRHRRTWVLYTSYLPSAKLQEPLDQWLQRREGEFVRLPIKAITALAFHSTEPGDPEARLKEQIVILEDLAQVSADDQEAWLRHEALAQAHDALADLLERRGERVLAAEHRKKAEETRAAAPRPW